MTNLVSQITKIFISINILKELAKKYWYQGQLKVGQTNKFISLDKYFCKVFPFTDLKLFQYYKKMI